MRPAPVQAALAALAALALLSILPAPAAAEQAALPLGLGSVAASPHGLAAEVPAAGLVARALLDPAAQGCGETPGVLVAGACARASPGGAPLFAPAVCPRSAAGAPRCEADAFALGQTGEYRCLTGSGWALFCWGSTGPLGGPSFLCFGTAAGPQAYCALLVAAGDARVLVQCLAWDAPAAAEPWGMLSCNAPVWTAERGVLPVVRAGPSAAVLAGHDLGAAYAQACLDGHAPALRPGTYCAVATGGLERGPCLLLAHQPGGGWQHPLRACLG